MKKLIIIIFFFTVFFKVEGMCSDSLNYFPLAVGNKWVYLYITIDPYPYPPYSIKVRDIRRDTLINGKIYYTCYGWDLTNPSYYKVIRYDTPTNKLMKPSTSQSCNFEYSIYDFSLNLNDTMLGDCKETRFMCYLISDTVLFNINTFVKGLHYGVPDYQPRYETYDFASSFGQIYGSRTVTTNAGTYGYGAILKGCVINGIVYGDTTTEFHDYSVRSATSFPRIFFKDSTYSIIASISNNGDYPETNIPINYLINDIQIDQYLCSLPIGGVDKVEFTWTPHDTGSYKIAVASALNSDQVRLNDTLKKNATVVLVRKDFSSGPFVDIPFLFIKDSSYHIKAKIKNEGNVDESNVPIKFLVDGTQAGYYLRSVPAGKVDSVDFIWTPHTSGEFNLAIATALSNDVDRSNDTVKVDVKVYPAPPIPIFCDDFTGGTENWIITNEGGECIWQVFSYPYPNWYSLPSTAAGEVLSADAYYCGLGSSLLSTATIIENVDCSLYEDIYLEFDNCWNEYYYKDSAFVEVSYDGGLTWSTIIAWHRDVRGTHEYRSLPGAASNTNVKIRFRSIQPEYGKWWVIDNVCIKGFPLTGLTQNSGEIPTKYALMQNYPNPFNPTTKIRFDLPKSTHAKLIIYDILGREVATLVNEKLNAGSYIIDWNGSTYPSGVYFYKLVTNNFVDIKKMLLVK